MNHVHYQLSCSFNLGKIDKEDAMKEFKFVHVTKAIEQILNFWKEVLTRNGRKDLVFCHSCRGIWKEGDGKKELVFCDSSRGDGDKKLCGECQLTKSGELLQEVSEFVQMWSEETPHDAAIEIMNVVRGVAHPSS